MSRSVRIFGTMLLILFAVGLLVAVDAAAYTPEQAVAFFQSISGYQFLVGQMGAYGDGYTPALVDHELQLFAEASGQYPAIVGMDYWRADKTLEDSIAEANPILTYWHNQGAFVTLTTHFHTPFKPHGTVNDRTGNINLLDLLYPYTTTAGARWKGYLDTVAAGLQQLEDAGVTVMWRPLMEMNGTWFWWGAPANPNDFKALWQDLYNYLENTKGLSNLIWVYGPNAGSNVTLYYPGHDYVDVVGLDKYMSLAETRGDIPLTIEGYDLLAQLGKPIYLSEFGPRPADASGQDIPFDYRRLVNDIVTRYPMLFGVFHWEWVWKLAYEYDQWGAAYNTADDYMLDCHTLSLNEAPVPGGCGTPPPTTETPVETPTPTSTPTPSPVDTHGVKGQYYNGIGFDTTPVLTRIDPEINFRWGRESPAVGVNSDQFSACWTGYLVPPYSDAYTFYTRVNDGVRLWVDGTLVFDSWTDKSRTTYIESSFTMTLTANQLYPMQMQYYENTVAADVELSWSSLSQYKQIIPESYLMSGPGNTCDTTMMGAAAAVGVVTGVEDEALPSDLEGAPQPVETPPPAVEITPEVTGIPSTAATPDATGIPTDDIAADEPPAPPPDPVETAEAGS